MLYRTSTDYYTWVIVFKKLKMSYVLPNLLVQLDSDNLRISQEGHLLFLGCRFLKHPGLDNEKTKAKGSRGKES